MTRGFPLKRLLFCWKWPFPNLLKMAFIFNHISSGNNDLFFWGGCWRPNFPLVWPHGSGSQQKNGLGTSDPRVYFSTELRWPGLHSWRWGHGGDVDVLVGDVFVFKVLMCFDVWWGVWRLDVTEKCYSCGTILSPVLILISKQQEEQDIRVTALPISGGKLNVPALVRIA